MIQIFDSNSIRLEKPSMIEIEENQNQGKDKFKKLCVRCDNQCIVVKDCLLKNSNNTFSADKQLKLNKECDKILITDLEGEKVVFIFELKSTFSKGLEAGIPQLRASCFKLHVFLNCIDAFLFDEYKFRAVLALWKPTIEQVLQITKEQYLGEVSDRKKLMIEVFDHDVVHSVIDRSRSEAYYSLPIKSEYKYDVPLSLFTTDYNNQTANVDLSKIL